LNTNSKEWTSEQERIIRRYIEENEDGNDSQAASKIAEEYPEWNKSIDQLHSKIHQVQELLNDPALIVEEDRQFKTKLARQSTKAAGFRNADPAFTNGPVVSYDRDPQEFLNNDLPAYSDLQKLPAHEQVRLLNIARKYTTNKRLAACLGITLSQLSYLFVRLGIYNKKKEKEKEAKQMDSNSKIQIPEGFALSYKGKMKGDQLGNRLLKASEFVEGSSSYYAEILLIELAPTEENPTEPIENDKKRNE